MVTITDEGLSYVQYEADGSAVNFALTFPYLLEAHISVFKNGVLQTPDEDWTWLNVSEIQMDEAPADGDLITVKRDTQRTSRFVDFEDGGVLREATLDLDSNQIFYIAQEAIDTTNFNLAINSTDSTIDAQFNKIINLADGTNDQDAVNKQQLDVVSDLATTADANATTALSTANGLSASIATANSNASTALGAANAAVITANAAEDTANGLASSIATANSNASTALSTANTASSNATTALSTANTALTNAATAQSTADTHALLTEAHGATGAVVGTTNTQTLTNKTLQGANIQTPSRLDVKQDTRANLETYASTASNGQLCFATDLKKMYQVVDSVLKDVGGAGGLNYIEGGDAEGGVIGTSYKDTAASAPEDGTGGSPTVTLTVSAVDPLRGTKSFVFSKDAADRQGEGHGIPFTIDPADLASIQRISFDYNTSANYVDGDMRVYVYDVTNSRLIEVIDRDLYASSFGKYVGTFQTSSDSTSYRLIFHVASTNDTAYDVKIDNVVLGPQVLIKGAIQTDWESYTPVFQGYGTPTNVEMQWRRNGPNLEVRGKFTAGTTTAVEGRIGLPSGLTTSSTPTTIYPVGNLFRGASASSIFAQVLAEPSVTYFTQTNALVTDTNNPFTKGNASSLIVTGDIVSLIATVPIQGWSSNMTLSEDAGNREIYCLAERVSGTNQTVSATGVTTIEFNTTVDDTTGSFNTGTYTYTIPETGVYDLHLMVYAIGLTTVDNNYVAIRVNGVINAQGYSVGSTANSWSLPKTLSLDKGDTVTAIFNSATDASYTIDGSTARTYLTIAKRSSPQTIGAGDVVACRYTSNSGQAVVNNSIIVFEDLDYDTHNAYNSSTGEWICPQSGYYNFQAALGSAAVAAGATDQFIAIKLTNVTDVLYGKLTRAYSTSSVKHTADIAATVFFSKGDVVSFRFLENIPAVNLETDTTSNWMSITKINGAS